MFCKRVSLQGTGPSWKAADLSLPKPLLGSKAMCKSPRGCQGPVPAGTENTHSSLVVFVKFIRITTIILPQVSLPICQPPSLLVVFKFLGTSLTGSLRVLKSGFQSPGGISPQAPELCLHQLMAEAWRITAHRIKTMTYICQY